MHVETSWMPEGLQIGGEIYQAKRYRFTESDIDNVFDELENDCLIPYSQSTTIVSKNPEFNFQDKPRTLVDEETK